jgi:hypothetical protein
MGPPLLLVLASALLLVLLVLPGPPVEAEALAMELVDDKPEVPELDCDWDVALLEDGSEPVEELLPVTALLVACDDVDWTPALEDPVVLAEVPLAADCDSLEVPVDENVPWLEAVEPLLLVTPPPSASVTWETAQ